MANLGDIFMRIGLRDDATAPLMKFQGKLKDAVAPMKAIGDATAISGLAVAGFGHGLTKLGPGFEEIGKLARGFGLAQSAVGGFFSGMSRMYDKLQAVNTAMNEFGGVMPMLNAGMKMFRANLLSLVGVIMPLLPLILTLAAVGFALYTIWSENLFGIQDIVMGVFGDISAILAGVIDFMKGFVVGVVEGLLPAFKVLGMMLMPITKSLSWLADKFQSSSTGAFNLGRVVGKVLAPAFLIFGIYLLSIVIPALWGMASAVIAATWPFLLVAVAIGLVVAGFYYLFKWIGIIVEKFGLFKTLAFVLFPIIIPIMLMVKAFQWLWSVTTKWRESLKEAIGQLKIVQIMVKGLSLLWDIVKKSFMLAMEPFIQMFEMAKAIMGWFGKLFGGDEKDKEKGGMEGATDTLAETGRGGITNAPVSRTQNATSNVNIEGGIANEADSSLLSKKIARNTASELGGMG